MVYALKMACGSVNSNIPSLPPSRLAETAVLKAAKRRRDVARAAVDVDVARQDAFSNLRGFFLIRTPDGAVEARTWCR